MNTDHAQAHHSAEAELASFRQTWKDEVTARAAGKAPDAPNKSATPSSSKSIPARNREQRPAPSTHARQRSIEQVDESAPYGYQDLGEKNHGRRLDETSAQTATALLDSQLPSSALEHYEKAVEKESQGNLGDSVKLYRAAFKLDDNVHETYKAKHFPPSSAAKPPKTHHPSSTTPGSASASLAVPPPAPSIPNPNPSNASATVPNAAHHSLQGLSPSLQTLMAEFSTLSILGEAPPTDLSPPPPCPISTIPEEILVEILEQLAVRDMASFVRLAQVCKRLAYLVLTEDGVWKRLALGHEYGFAAMHYAWTCEVNRKPLGHDNDDDGGGFVLGTSTPDTSSDTEDLETPRTQSTSTSTSPPYPIALTLSLVPSTYPTYRSLFRLRPRIRFNGCYISTVNYMRPGQPSPTSVSWNSPIHIVTYYRYLRFLRDGTCISLLTTSEPADVVPYLWVEHMHAHHGALPSAPMKDAVLGRWLITGPDMSSSSSTPLPPSRTIHAAGSVHDKEGTLIIETAGATPKYINKMVLSIGGAGRTGKNNKLSWQRYWSYNRLTDDWAEFLLKNDRDRAFRWSRVKSYGLAWDEGGMLKA